MKVRPDHPLPVKPEHEVVAVEAEPGEVHRPGPDETAAPLPVGAAHRDVLAVVVVHDLTGQLVGADDAAHRDPAAPARVVEDPLDLLVQHRVDDLDAAARVPLATHLAGQVVAAVVEPRVHADPDHRAARDRPGRRCRFFVFVFGCAFEACPGFFLAVLARALRTGIPVCGVARQLIRRSTRTIGSRRGSAIACGNAQYTALVRAELPDRVLRPAVGLHLVEQHSQAHVRLLADERVHVVPLAPRGLPREVGRPDHAHPPGVPDLAEQEDLRVQVAPGPRHDRRQERAKLTSAGDIPCARLAAVAERPLEPVVGAAQALARRGSRAAAR